MNASTATEIAVPNSPIRTMLFSRVNLATFALVGAGAAVALTVQAGWLLRWPTVTGGFGAPLTMTASMAGILLLAALTIIVLIREGESPTPSRALLVSAGSAAVLVVWSLVEVTTGWRIGIEAVMAASVDTGAGVPGPAILTLMATLSLLGATVLASHPARYDAAQALVLGTIAVATFEVAGELVTVPGDAGPARAVMASPAAVALLLLSLGLLASKPDKGFVAWVLDEGPGGTMVRRYLPVAVVTPVVAGWLIWRGVAADLYGAGVGVALLVTIASLVPAGLLLFGSRVTARFARDGSATSLAGTRAETPDQLRRALVNAPVPMVVHDGDQILQMNEAWTGLAGVNVTETPTLGAWFAEVLPSKVEGLPAFRERLAEATGTVDDGEQIIRMPDGQERVWHLSSTPITQPGSGQRLYLTMAVDVTGRHVAETALRRLNDDLEQRAAERTAALTKANDALKRQSDQLRERTLLLDLVREGILVRDLYGTIVYWNQGAATMYGWSKEQVLGKVSHQLLAAEYPMPLAEIEKAVMQNGFWEGDVIHVTRSGTRVMVESRWTLTRTERGKPEGFLEVHRDITLRRQAELALKAKHDALARSNHELEQFAYVASHDLQEPLRMVSNYTQLLAKRYRDRLDADANEFIGFAVDGARRMQDLINDLLQYARVERRPRDFRPIATATIVGDALANLAGAISESGASIVVESLPTVTCDGSQMTQVFQNLIGNAIKFSKPDQAPVVKVSAVREEDGWRLSVADNGIGIEPRFFERIFHMFQRLHARGEYEGTGIGLAICKKIVERHGGQMRVASAPGHGATFSFTIPDAIPSA